MAKATKRFEFTVEVDGKTYHCHRIVSGTRALTQQIHVDGIGSKPDGVQYGQNGRSAGTMESIARLIARELIKQNRAADRE